MKKTIIIAAIAILCTGSINAAAQNSEVPENSGMRERKENCERKGGGEIRKKAEALRAEMKQKMDAKRAEIKALHEEMKQKMDALKAEGEKKRSEMQAKRQNENQNKRNGNSENGGADGDDNI